MYQHIKRTIDISASLCALLILWPLLLVIAVLIRLESVGSPFFLQQRMGRNLRPFYIVKFRSMVKNAPIMGGFQTQDNDPRITRVGAFIRKTSMDELPQLWNVLMGDMSLVGPRPNTPAQENQYSKEAWKMRHSVLPGITGLAQVSGRSNLSSEQQVAYDLQYVREVSLGLDMRIIIQTALQLASKTGIN